MSNNNTGSSVDSLCLQDEVRTSDFNEVAGEVFVILTPVVSAAVVATFLAHSKYTIINKRMFTPIFLSLVGAVIQTGWGVFEMIGREGFSCAFLSYISFIIVTFQMGSFSVRLAGFYFRVQKNKALAKASLSDALQNKEQFYGALVGTDGGSVSDVMKTSKASVSRVSKKTPTEVETRSLGSLSVFYPSNALLFFASPRFSKIACAILVLVTVAVAVPLSLRDEVRECSFPCKRAFVGYEYLLGGFFILVGFGSYFSWKIRKEPDPLYIKLEMEIAFTIGTFTAVPPLLVQMASEERFISPGDASVILLWLLGNLLLIINQFMLPVFLIYRQKRIIAQKAADADDLSFEEVVASQTGRDYFQAFAVSEFSMENYAFYKEVVAWKKMWTNKKRQIAIDRAANEIIANFIDTNARFPINIPGYAKEALLRREEKEPSMFDECLEEITELMKTDTFFRFRQTEAYKNLVGLEARRKTEYIKDPKDVDML